MGDNFENQQVAAYQRIVKDYPLSVHVDDARAQLEVANAHDRFRIDKRSRRGGGLLGG